MTIHVTSAFVENVGILFLIYLTYNFIRKIFKPKKEELT